MIDPSPLPPAGAKPCLDLRIRWDSDHRIVAISLNDQSTDIGQSGLTAPPAAEDCCGGSVSASMAVPLGSTASGAAAIGVQRAGQSPAEIAADCAARSQDYLVQMLRNAALTLMTLMGAQLLILYYISANATAILNHYGW
jgi:hypothetical protein